MKDVMLDLETLGTRYDAMIISIGACYFDRITGEIGRGFSVNVMPENDKFSVDYGTVKWWFEQSDKARGMVMENPVPLEIALDGLITFIGPDTTVWSHATFDMPILQNAFDSLKKKSPIPFRNMRDLRTLMDIANHHSSTERNGVHHHALDDAKFQATYAAEAFRKLNGQGV